MVAVYMTASLRQNGWKIERFERLNGNKALIHQDSIRPCMAPNAHLMIPKAVSEVSGTQPQDPAPKNSRSHEPTGYRARCSALLELQHSQSQAGIDRLRSHRQRQGY
jgi:hypothetical protein